MDFARLGVNSFAGPRPAGMALPHVEGGGFRFRDGLQMRLPEPLHPPYQEPGAPRRVGGEFTVGWVEWFIETRRPDQAKTEPTLDGRWVTLVYLRVKASRRIAPLTLR